MNPIEGTNLVGANIDIDVSDSNLTARDGTGIRGQYRPRSPSAGRGDIDIDIETLGKSGYGIASFHNNTGDIDIYVRNQHAMVDRAT